MSIQGNIPCPHCGDQHTRITRTVGNARTRECSACQHSFQTFEVYADERHLLDALNERLERLKPPAAEYHPIFRVVA